MKISLRAPSRSSADSLHSLAEVAATTSGVHRFWTAENFGERAGLVTVANLGARWPELRVGVGTVACHVSHPIGIAQQIATVRQLTGVDLAVGLGIGSRSERASVGATTTSPLSLARDHLTRVRAALTAAGAPSDANGSEPLQIWQAPAEPTPLYLGAIGPRMLTLAGELADGVIFSLGCTSDYLSTAVETFRRDRVGSPGWCVAYVLYSGDVTADEHHRMMAPVVGHFLQIITVADNLLPMVSSMEFSASDLQEIAARVRSGEDAARAVPPQLTNRMAARLEDLPRWVHELQDAGVDEVALGFGGWNLDLPITRLGVAAAAETAP